MSTSDTPAVSSNTSSETRPITRVLITGGCGFIGSNLIRFLRQQRPEWTLINLDLLTYSGNPENLADLAGDEKYQFVRGSINDSQLLMRILPNIDVIMHLAAESHVDRSILDPRPFIETNVLGTQTLLEAWRQTIKNNPQGRRFLHVSTDEVYGSLPLDDPQRLFTEDTPIEPNSPYASSKAASDLVARAYHHTFGLDVLTTRCSNNFGPYQFPEKVIPLFVTNLFEGKKVPLYGDGKNVRDWLHVEDNCEALLAVLERGKAGRVYNVGGNNERSNLELTHAILLAMGKGPQMIEPVADRLGHDRRYAIDASRIKAELGWEPTRSKWPDALASTVKWYVDHPAWWQHVKTGEYRTYYDKQYTQR
jgi:dTDP-glucose 4,6-dehydratase